MNPETLLNEVEKLILHREFNLCRRMHLCHFTDRMQVLPVQHTDRPHTVFMDLNDKHFALGLSSPEWDLLLHKLLLFYKGKI